MTAGGTIPPNAGPEAPPKGLSVEPPIPFATALVVPGDLKYDLFWDGFAPKMVFFSFASAPNPDTDGVFDVGAVNGAVDGAAEPLQDPPKGLTVEPTNVPVPNAGTVPTVLKGFLE